MAGAQKMPDVEKGDLNKYEFRAFHPKEGLCDSKKLRELDISLSFGGEVLFGNNAVEPNWIVMLSTGLLDVDGKPIFEGDIIEVDVYPFFSDGLLNYRGVVTNIQEPGYMGWYYELHAVSSRVRGIALGSGLADLEGMAIKVVGNIYETPDLLEHETIN